MHSKNTKIIALALGSNLGNRQAHIAFAIQQLDLHGIQNIQCAEALESAPIDCPDGSATYLNTALTAEWHGSANELLKIALKIEKLAGRERSGTINESRELDIDLLLIEDEIHNTKQLVIPHPRMHLRGFVLRPLSHLKPEWIIPGITKTIQQSLEALEQYA